MSDTTTTPPAAPGLVPGGTHDDDGNLRTDDFGLDGDLKAQLAAALGKVWNAEDPGATELPPEDDATTQPDPSSADTAATPAPAPTTSVPADSTQGQPDGDGAGGGRAAEDGGGAATPAADATPAPTPDDEFNAGDYFNSYFGTPLNREQAQHLAGIIGGLQNLTPQQRAELDRTLAQGPGQYPATMGQPAAPGPPQFPQQPGQPVGAPVDDPAVAVLGARPDDDYLGAQWDMAAASHRATASQMAALREDIARNTEAEMQRQQAATSNAIDAATASWRDRYPDLTDGEYDGLISRAAQSQTFPGLVQAHHGDIAAATNMLLEQHLWSDPTLRDRAIANIASGRAAGDATTPDPASPVAQQQAATDAGRQALAASVAGGGGSVTPATNAIPTDPDKRKAAMAQEIAANHDFT